MSEVVGVSEGPEVLSRRWRRWCVSALPSCCVRMLISACSCRCCHSPEDCHCLLFCSPPPPPSLPSHSGQVTMVPVKLQDETGDCEGGPDAGIRAL